MLKKLWKAHNGSETTVPIISKMAKLVAAKYSNSRDDIPKQNEQMRGFLEQLRSMHTTLQNSGAIEMLVASPEAPKLAVGTASIKTLAI